MLKILFFLALILPPFLYKENPSETARVDSLETDQVYFSDDNIKNDSLYSKAFIINNGSFKVSAYKKKVLELTPSFERTILISLLQKKEGDFRAMFDTLYAVFKSSPQWYLYYNELSFAASATGQISLLESGIEKTPLPDKHISYLLGRINLSRNNSAAAIKFFEEALKSAPNSYEILFELSNAYKGSGEYDKSLEMLEKIEQTKPVYPEVNNKLLIARGTLQFLSGNYIKAEKFYTSAYESSRKSNDLQNLTTSLVDLGIIADNKGDIEKGRKYYSEAHSYAAKINYLEGKAFASSELGVSYSYTNNLIEAKDSYLESYSLYKQMGNRLRLSLLSDNLGKIYMAMFDYKSAIKYYEEGLQLAGDNKRAQILNLLGLADIYSNLSNYSKALDYYKKAERLSGEIKELSLQSQVNNGLGALNFNLSNYKTALTYFTHSSNLIRNEDNIYLKADCFHKLGISYLELDSLAQSEKYLLSSIELSKTGGDTYTEASALLDVSLVYFKMKSNDKAFNFVNRSKLISQKYKFAYLRGQAEIILGDYTVDFNSARGHYYAALQSGKSINNSELQIQSYASLAKLYSKHHLREAADSYFSSAVNLIDDISRPLFNSEEVQIKYFAAKKDIYDSYAQLLLAEKKYARAFMMIDRSMSRNMIQNLNNLKLQAMIKDKEILNQLYEYDWMIQSGIYHGNMLDSLKIVYASFKNDLVSKVKGIEKYLNLNHKYKIEEYIPKLSDQENIISFYSNEEGTFVFLLSSKGLKSFQLNVKRSELQGLLTGISPYFHSDADSSKTYYNQDLFSFNSDASYEMYNKLLSEPLKSIVKGSKIVFIPPVELTAFPFEMFVTEKQAAGSAFNYKDKKFLIYDYDITYSPSLSAYIEQKENLFSNKNKILIVGDPAINNAVEGYSERRGLLEEKSGIPRNISLLPLRYSREEVNNIGDIVDADKILTDKNATETNFKLDAELSSIIHLSTHSFLVNQQPVIFFSNYYDPENDGFLEAGEIAQLNLNSDLIVLSSCNSGLGEIDEAEGVLGMTKAFFETGAKSIVVSLWEVNDKYTSLLMTLFYQKLSEGLDKGNALREAKLEFIKKYSPNPYYWGAFILSGNTGTIQLKQNKGFDWYWAFAAILLVSALIFVLGRNHILKDTSS